MSSNLAALLFNAIVLICFTSTSSGDEQPELIEDLESRISSLERRVRAIEQPGKLIELEQIRLGVDRMTEVLI